MYAGYVSEWTWIDDFGFIAFVIAVYLLMMLVVFFVSAALYAMQSHGLYTIAKRREIRRPWLAWLPLGNMWILGSISDQYRYVTKREVKNKRIGLLFLTLLIWMTLAAILTVLISFWIRVSDVATDSYMLSILMRQAYATMLALTALGLILSALVISGVVVQYMAVYDLYASCQPENRTAFLLLSILIPVIMPVLMFLCRKKDLGMPPRRTEQPIEE